MSDGWVYSSNTLSDALIVLTTFNYFTQYIITILIGSKCIYVPSMPDQGLL